MRNFKITAVEDSKSYWISRSVAVAGFVFKYTKDAWYILANKRGTGCPDNVGRWVCPCGYLDWDESGSQACSREILEECGLKVRPVECRLVGVDDNPASEYQNVTLRYIVELYGDRPFIERKGGEENEVAEVAWIKIEDIDNYEWAFNHGYRIKELFDNYIH